jgi:drug/metabolite transporter (DMT)-like permease
MLAMRLIGALCILAGLVFMAGAAIYRGRLSDPRPNPSDTVDRTLEPRRRGLGFLGLKSNLVGLAMIILGLFLFILSLFLGGESSPPG